ncbi:unnamed protein product [Acanthosepion pharaonis]|uniref:Peptidase A2 domain-containing protein n=1 Tax=Acanthosepion pharaonis TaxID=158019 RepID=A0A812B1R1_ACAPH|nr:unnamed protein product [Sepia pharaonis]
MPAFNSNVQTWFLQLDAIFQARHVTSQQSKFASVVEKLPAEVAAEVADILTSLPIDKPYETLKQAILHRSGFSEKRKIRDLLTNVTIGDSKPSQLLRRMQQLLGDNNISATVFRQMWLDKLHELQEISLQLRDLQKPHESRRDNFTRHSNRGSRSTSRHKYQQRRDRYQHANCWYHENFGARAKKCRPPCSYKKVISKQTSGKRTRWHPVETLDARHLKTNRLFYIHDRASGLKFLVDTGAQISVLPLKNCSKQTLVKHTSFKLQAANGTPIITYGERTLTLDIGLRREFTWIFTIADVSMPILGADFLTHYKLSVELASQTLTDTSTNLQRYGFISKYSTIGLTTVIPTANGYDEIIRQYQSLPSPSTHNEPVKHHATHSIKTTGPPVHSQPHRLHPSKLKIARDEFDNMLKLGQLPTPTSTIHACSIQHSCSFRLTPAASGSLLQHPAHFCSFQLTPAASSSLLQLPAPPPFPTIFISFSF